MNIKSRASHDKEHFFRKCEEVFLAGAPQRMCVERSFDVARA
jgi:hypothetical protein